MNAYELLTQSNTFAVLGMNNDPEKYAYKIFYKLKEKNKQVFGVNPKYDVINDDPIYPSIDAIEEDVEVAVFVVNPKIGIHYLDDLKKRGIKHVWLQPGTVDDALLKRAEELNLQTTEACVLALYSIYDK